MGYTSDVAIKCQYKAYEKFDELCKRHNRMADRIYFNGDGEYVLIWEWVKWYGDDFVDECETIIEYLEDEHDEEDGWGFKWLLIGEDGVTEERTNNWDVELYVKHEFDFASNAFKLIGKA